MPLAPSSRAFNCISFTTEKARVPSVTLWTTGCIQAWLPDLQNWKLECKNYDTVLHNNGVQSPELDVASNASHKQEHYRWPSTVRGDRKSSRFFTNSNILIASKYSSIEINWVYFQCNRPDWNRPNQARLLQSNVNQK